MLQELIRLWPGLRGQGWELAKIHEQLHVPDDIERNGAPQGSHTGPNKHNHIQLVKRPARGTQQQAEVLDQQLGQQVSDTYIVDMAYQRMTTSYDSFLPEAERPVQTTGVSPPATSKCWCPREPQRWRYTAIQYCQALYQRRLGLGTGYHERRKRVRFLFPPGSLNH
jgi:hypothetical protein